MRKLFTMLLFVLAIALFAVSCTRDPERFEYGERRTSEESETTGSSDGTGNGGIGNGGANTEEGWGELIPIS